jgi:hypothetical protein
LHKKPKEKAEKNKVMKIRDTFQQKLEILVVCRERTQEKFCISEQRTRFSIPDPG